MHNTDTTTIDESVYDLLAEHGERLAVIAAINLDAQAIVGVYTFHRYESAYAMETVSPQPAVDRYDTYHHLLDHRGGDPQAINSVIHGMIEDQQYTDDPTAFTWELITGTDAVQSNGDLAKTLTTTIGPDRLDPPFDVPDDEPVATVDCTYEEHDIINESNNRYGYADLQIERFRGTTYLIGLTEEMAETLAKGCHDLKREYSDGGMHDSAQVADSAEGIVLNAPA